jgi:hypothetical protein
MGIAEYDTATMSWDGVPSAVFVGMPYIQLIGPDGGKYVIFKGPQGGLVIVPFVNMETGLDGWQHNTCGYLITWEP